MNDISKKIDWFLSLPKIEQDYVIWRWKIENNMNKRLGITSELRESQLAVLMSYNHADS